MLRNISLYTFLLISFFSCRQAPADVKEELELQRPEQLYGQLFVDVQMEAVFPDSKTFVDCTPKIGVEEILNNYTSQKNLESFDLKTFVLEHFDLPKQYATGFQSDTSRSVEEHINVLWDYLTREADKPSAGTLIGMPKPYIVPGGRFGEVYYWDSYFTMLGLEVAGRTDMVKNMADNFAHIIDTVGHIP
ncbi:MAG: trehalase family glycosidase, partial [Bacteroidota bacterium]